MAQTQTAVSIPYLSIRFKTNRSRARTHMAPPQITK